MTGLCPTHIEFKVTSLVASLSLDAPHVPTLVFDRGTLTVETVALSLVALDEIFDVEVGWALSRGPGAKFGEITLVFSGSADIAGLPQLEKE